MKPNFIKQSFSIQHSLFSILFLLLISILSAAEKKQPNVIIFLTDDQEWRNFNFLPEGKDKDGKARNLTPNLDKMVEEGVVFTRNYSNSSVCTPSRYNILTGSYASRAHGVNVSKDGMVRVEWNTHIYKDTPTLQKTLAENNIQTAMVGKNHVIKSSKLQKIKRDDDIKDPIILEKLKQNQIEIIKAIHDTGFHYASHIYNSNIPINAPKTMEDHNLEWILQGGKQFLKQKEDRPYFLYFPITMNHGPHRYRAWKGNPLSTPVGPLKEKPGGIAKREELAAKVKAAGLPEEQVDLTYMDAILGALFHEIKDRGEADNTVVFLLTDHGVNNASKGHLYDGGTRSPLVVWGPGYFSGGKIKKSIVQTLDLAPTILELMNIEKPTNLQFDGKSILPLLKDEKEEIHESIALEIGISRAIVKGKYKYLTIREPQDIKELTREGRQALLDKTIKFHKEVEGRDHHNHDPMAPFGHMGKVPGSTHATSQLMKRKPTYFDIDQLYDLEKDPSERKNLAKLPEYATLLKSMQSEMRKSLSKMPGEFAEFTDK